MKYNQTHLELLKNFLERKIESKDINEEDKSIIIELCKARKKQLENKIKIKRKELNELNKKSNLIS